MLVNALSGSGGSISSSGLTSTRIPSRRDSLSTIPSRSAPWVTTMATSATTLVAFTDRITASRHSLSEIQLATGQVVDVERLATHLRRKRIQARYYAQKAAAAAAMQTVRPPKSFYVCEAVLDSTRSYIVCVFYFILFPLPLLVMRCWLDKKGTGTENVDRKEVYQ